MICDFIFAQWGLDFPCRTSSPHGLLSISSLSFPQQIAYKNRKYHFFFPFLAQATMNFRRRRAVGGCAAVGRVCFRRDVRPGASRRSATPYLPHLLLMNKTWAKRSRRGRPLSICHLHAWPKPRSTTGEGATSGRLYRERQRPWRRITLCASPTLRFPRSSSTLV